MAAATHVSFTSRKGHHEACRALRRACRRHGLTVLAETDLAARLRHEGVPVAGEWTSFDVLAPEHARTLLEADVLAKILLPCRVAVHTAPCGATRFDALRPTCVVSPSIEPALLEPARRLEATLEAVVAEAGRLVPRPSRAAPP
jgi:uncharacterized protein (DUF302 family)